MEKGRVFHFVAYSCANLDWWRGEKPQVLLANVSSLQSVMGGEGGPGVHTFVWWEGREGPGVHTFV